MSINNVFNKNLIFVFSPLVEMLSDNYLALIPLFFSVSYCKFFKRKIKETRNKTFGN